MTTLTDDIHRMVATGDGDLKATAVKYLTTVIEVCQDTLKEIAPEVLDRVRRDGE